MRDENSLMTRHLLQKEEDGDRNLLLFPKAGTFGDRFVCQPISKGAYRTINSELIESRRSNKWPGEGGISLFSEDDISTFRLVLSKLVSLQNVFPWRSYIASIFSYLKTDQNRLKHFLLKISYLVRCWSGTSGGHAIMYREQLRLKALLYVILVKELAIEVKTIDNTYAISLA